MWKTCPGIDISCGFRDKISEKWININVCVGLYDPWTTIGGNKCLDSLYLWFRELIFLFSPVLGYRYLPQMGPKSPSHGTQISGCLFETSCQGKFWDIYILCVPDHMLTNILLSDFSSIASCIVAPTRNSTRSSCVVCLWVASTNQSFPCKRSSDSWT